MTKKKAPAPTAPTRGARAEEAPEAIVPPYTGPCEGAHEPMEIRPEAQNSLHDGLAFGGRKLHVRVCSKCMLVYAELG